MPLPACLDELDDETTVLGDVDAFIHELETGLMRLAYDALIARRLRELDELSGYYVS